MSINIKQGNCLELMSKIPDKSVDLILCDLPYETTNNKIDIRIPFGLLWEQYLRIIKDNGAILLFAQGLFFVDLVNSQRKLYRYDLVWDKKLVSGFLNANRMPLRRTEQIAVFYKKLPTYNPQFTEGNPLHGKGTKYLDSEIINNNYGAFEATPDTRKGCTQKYPTNLLSFSKPHPAVSHHPTEKSVSLLAWLIKTYTNKGDTVLDNCMGSGSTGVACVNTQRNFIGFELDEKHFAVAKDRIENAKYEICEDDTISLF